MIFNKSKGTGRRQNTRQELSARVNWIVFQLRGISVSYWFRQVACDICRFEIRDEDLYKFYALRARAEAALKELKAVEQEVAQWNKNKKWVE